MNILITGNRGFIASGLEGDGIDLKDGQDIHQYKAKKKYDVVIHTAAETSVTKSIEYPHIFVYQNIQGTVSILKEHPESHFIYLSTAGVYGEGIAHTVLSPLNPQSVYASTKLAGEFLVKNLAKSWCILRLTNVIGPGERGEPNVYQVFEKEEVLPIYGDGHQTRDFIHVDNVRKLIRSFAKSKKQGLFNVGSGVSKTVLDVAMEFKKPLQFLPARKGEIRHFGVLDAIGNITQL